MFIALRNVSDIDERDAARDHQPPYRTVQWASQMRRIIGLSHPYLTFKSSVLPVSVPRQHSRRPPTRLQPDLFE